MIDLMKHPWVNGSLPQLEPHKKSTETINELDLEDAAIEVFPINFIIKTKIVKFISFV